MPELTPQQRARVEAAYENYRTNILACEDGDPWVERMVTAADEQLRALIKKLHTQAERRKAAGGVKYWTGVGITMALDELSEYVLPEDQKQCP